MKIIEICDVNSEGHKVRLADGTYTLIPHSTHDIVIGAEYPAEALELDGYGQEPWEHAPTIEHLNSDAQVAANILSEQVSKDALPE